MKRQNYLRDKLGVNFLDFLCPTFFGQYIIMVGFFYHIFTSSCIFSWKEEENRQCSEILHALLSSADFFQTRRFQKIISKIPSE